MSLKSVLFHLDILLYVVKRGCTGVWVFHKTTASDRISSDSSVNLSLVVFPFVILGGKNVCWQALLVLEALLLGV